MFEFTFGLSWTIFMIFFTIPFLITKEVNLFAILVIGGFWIIGIVILVKGIKKVVANHKTEKQPYRSPHRRRYGRKKLSRRV